MWVDHMRSEWYVTGAGVTWGFRGGGRTTCRGKSRGDGWDCYTYLVVEPPSPTSGRTPPVGALHKSSLKNPHKAGSLTHHLRRLQRSLHSYRTLFSRRPVTAKIRVLL